MGGPSIKRRQESHIDPREIADLVRCLLALMDDVEDLFGWNLSPDKRTIERRVADEGLGFLAKRLPEFHNWLLESLRSEKLQLPLPRFKATRKCGVERPAFLQKLTCQLFDSDGCFIKPNGEEDRAHQGEVLRSINFICTSFGKKYEVPLTDREYDEQVRKFFAFDENQCLNPLDNWKYLSNEAKTIVRMSRSLLKELFSDYKAPSVVDGQYVLVTHRYRNKPVKYKFGPGAVYEKYDAYEKYTRFKTPPLSAIRPLGLWEVFTPAPGTVNPDNIVNTEDFDSLERESWLATATGGGISRLQLVPKQSGVGRVVIIHGNELMYIQQGEMSRFYDWVEAHPLTRGQVSFTDQSINRRAALSASLDGSMCTLDEKSASDTVSMGHVDAYFDLDISTRLRLLRSHRIVAKLKNGEEISSDHIRMHAPMGSAVCFPIEALVFWASAKSALRVAGLDSPVYVYGDDVIVSSQGYEPVARAFGELGFIVNTRKSFPTGPFRESCGVDALSGYDATAPFKIKKRVPHLGIGLDESKRSKSVLAWVEYANLAEQRGFPSLATAIRHTIFAAYPKAQSFPQTHDITEIAEGYLAFLNYSYKGTVRRTRNIYPSHKDGIVLDYIPTSFQKGEDSVWYAKPSSLYEVGLMGPFIENSNEEIRSIKLGNLGTYKAAPVIPSRIHEVRRKKLYASGCTPDGRTYPEATAYLRWVLEKTEDSRTVPGNEFHIARRHVLLT